MKKIIYTILLSSLILLYGCSNNISKSNKVDNNYVTTEQVSDADDNQSKSTGHSNEPSNGEQSYVYKDDDVIVEKLTPLSEPNEVQNIWLDENENDIYGKSEVIARVSVTKLEEVSISYTFMGSQRVNYKTLASVTVEEVYYSDIELPSNQIVVALPYSSYEYDDFFPMVAEGDNCIMFMGDTSKLNDSHKLYNYANTYVSGPNDIVIISTDACQSSSIFMNYSQNSDYLKTIVPAVIDDGDIIEEEIIEHKGKCTMPTDDFISSMKNKIATLGGNYNEAEN